MSELVSQADLGLGKSVKGLQTNPSQAARYNVAQTNQPQIQLTPQGQIMSTQPVNQSLLTPIGDAPTGYMLPPAKRFISSLNPFSLFGRQTTR